MTGDLVLRARTGLGLLSLSDALGPGEVLLARLSELPIPPAPMPRVRRRVEWRLPSLNSTSCFAPEQAKEVAKCDEYTIFF